MRLSKVEGHRISWYVWVGDQKIRRSAQMRGRWPGWDVECSCGWGSHTGGAIKERVWEAMIDHKLEAGAEFLPRRSK